MMQAFLLVAVVALVSALPILVAGRSARAPQLDLNTTKLVVDVDAGADDAVAMLLALGEEKSNPGVQVLGITCVHGNTAIDNVMVNVLKTLQTAGRLDIPVYKGATRSLMITPPSDNYFGNDGFGDFMYHDPPKPEDYIQKEHAVNALVRLAKENKGELTVAALGSLTNIALAISMDSNFLSNLKQLVVLGGSVEGIGNMKPGIEFNFFMDAEATFIVFNSTNSDLISPIVLIPWESVKERNKITMDWRKSVLGAVKSPQVELINNAERLLLQGSTKRAQWASADPMAMAVALRPSLVTGWSQHHVDAETQGSYGRGAIFVDYNNRITPKNVIIVTQLDIEGYKDMMLEKFA